MTHSKATGAHGQTNIMAYAQVFYGPDHPLKACDVPLPSSLQAGEVLVEIALATICGSDLHTLSGHRPERTPCILGHEAVGHVVAVGSGRPDLRMGDRITWSIADSCGSCLACSDYNLPEKCADLFKYGHAPLDDGSGLNGCYASHILLRQGTHIVTLPDRLADATVAPANCALATVVNAAETLPGRCDSVLIQGAGLLGLYCCALLAERGIKRIYCMDLHVERRRHSADFGAIPVEHVQDVLVREKEGVDAVFELAGASVLLKDGLEALRPGGFYILVGMVHPDTQIDLTGEQIIRKCVTMRGVHNYSPRHLNSAVAFLSRTASLNPYDELVSPPIPLSELDRAIELAQSQRFSRVSLILS